MPELDRQVAVHLFKPNSVVSRYHLHCYPSSFRQKPLIIIMDAVEKANEARQKNWYVFMSSGCPHASSDHIQRIKDRKVGEGAYAVVYQGQVY